MIAPKYGNNFLMFVPLQKKGRGLERGGDLRLETNFSFKRENDNLIFFLSFCKPMNNAQFNFYVLYK
jgi:hypothetical protein